MTCAHEYTGTSIGMTTTDHYCNYQERTTTGIRSTNRESGMDVANGNARKFREGVSHIFL